MSDEPLPQSEIILYQTEDGRTRVQCRFENETLWLTQALIAELFQVTVPTVNEHLKSVFAEGELTAAATIRKFRIVRLEGRAGHRALQSRRHPRRRLPRAQPSGHAVPPMGHLALERESSDSPDEHIRVPAKITKTVMRRRDPAVVIPALSGRR